LHVFLLVLVIGDAEQKGTPMHFYDINRCNYFARETTKRYGNYRYSHNVPKEHRATAYCKPVYVDPKTVVIYE
jgi:hypothetical protein